MAEPFLIKTGQYVLDILSKTSEAIDFEIKFKIDCRSQNVSYLSAPFNFSLNGLSGMDLIGCIGLIYDNTLNSSTYFVVGSLDKSTTDSFRISEKAASNLNYKSGAHNISLYLFDAQIPELNKTNLDSQIQIYGISLGGLKETIFSDTSAGAQLSGEDSVNYKDFTPYIATVDRSSGVISRSRLNQMKSNHILGLIIEAGYLYDAYHVETQKYANPNLKQQVEICNGVAMPYGLFAVSRARSVLEAKKELEHLSTIIRSYPPKLGMWLKFSLSKHISINDNIINEYYKQFVQLGLMDQIGLYTTKSNLKQINWKNHLQWSLWLVDHVSTFTDLDQLLTPQFFKLNR